MENLKSKGWVIICSKDNHSDAMRILNHTYADTPEKSVKLLLHGSYFNWSFYEDKMNAQCVRAELRLC